MKFNIIYADPPWTFRTYSDKGKDRSPEKHYSVMNNEDIREMNVRDIVAENAILALWVTSPLLLAGINTLHAWGFFYKTVLFTWVKTNKRIDSFFFGLGYYTRANAEYCLLGTTLKGLEVLDHSVSSLIVTPIEAHSKKPPIVRENLVKLFGDKPRVELFAREAEEGWVSLGNEITGNDIREDLERIKNEIRS